MKKYDVKVKLVATIDFPIIEAKSKEEAIEIAGLLLLTDKHLEESQDGIQTWRVDKLIDG